MKFSSIDLLVVV